MTDADTILNDGLELRGEAHFLNIFTGKTEPFRTSEQATASMLVAAAGRIDELERQLAEIKAFLVI